MISVIIPVYNVEKYITRCLKSVINQSFNDLELILVDDCGTDNSIDYAENFLRSYYDGKWKIIHHNENRGLSSARNTGIIYSKGEYIYFLDADDAITTDCLSSLYNSMSSDVDFVMAKYINVPQSRNGFLFDDVELTRSGLIRQYIQRKLPWNAVNRLIRRAFLVNNGLYFKEGILSEDLLWNYSLLPYVNKVIILNKVTYHYYTNQGSIMHSGNANYKYSKDLSVIIREMYVIAQKTNNPDLTRYYFEIKNKYIPEAILWHNFPLRYKYKYICGIFQTQYCRFLASMRTVNQICLYYLKEIRFILLYKMKQVLHIQEHSVF